MWQVLGNMALVALLFFILYLVIGWAIDHSKTAKNLEIIRHILAEIYQNQEKTAAADFSGNIKAPNNVCPACHSEIKENVKFCTSCGIKLDSNFLNN